MNEWENRYRAGDTPWEKGAAHPALTTWLEKNSLPGRVLVPGCGSGHDVRVLAGRGSAAVGLDIAPSAIAAAREQPRAGRESYEEGDFFHPPAGWTGAFDGLFEHTCFCAIDPALRTAYARSAAQLVRSAGRFLAIFYLHPGVEEGPPFGCTTAELDALFSPAFRLLEERTELATHPGREGREVLRLYERL